MTEARAKEFVEDIISALSIVGWRYSDSLLAAVKHLQEQDKWKDLTVEDAATILNLVHRWGAIDFNSAWVISRNEINENLFGRIFQPVVGMPSDESQKMFMFDAVRFLGREPATDKKPTTEGRDESLS